MTTERTTEAGVMELAQAAERLGPFSRCLFLLRSGDRLVDAQGEGVELPLGGSFLGACLRRRQTQFAAIDDDRLDVGERSLLSASGVDLMLAVPIPFGDSRHEGLAVGLKRGTLGAGSGAVERTALHLIAEQFAMRWRLQVSQRALATERERARAVEQAGEGLLHSLRVGVLILRADDTLHDANRAAELLLRFDTNGCRGLPVSGFVHQPEIRRLIQTVDATAARPQEVCFGDEAPTFVEVDIYPVFDAAGQLQWRIVTVSEITELRRADVLKDQFVSTVSHELRTPLTTIKAFAATLLRAEQAAPGDAREWLAIINNECDRLTALINDLLTISRLDSGRRPELTVHTVTLVPLLREVIAPHAVAANRHEIRVDGDESVTVQADGEKLRQVFGNLVSNAIKYSPKGGPITLTVTRGDDEVRVTVRDQGVGIRPEHMNRIFEKFYQVDASSTRRVGGSGLGLYLARRLVEAHGGRLWVESEPGCGSTFCVSLPPRPRLVEGSVDGRL